MLWQLYWIERTLEWMKPQPPDRGPSGLRGRSHFGAAKARSAAA
jgi:hypothetical protein